VRGVLLDPFLTGQLPKANSTTNVEITKIYRIHIKSIIAIVDHEFAVGMAQGDQMVCHFWIDLLKEMFFLYVYRVFDATCRKISHV
jgi:hypothetical protein